MPGSGAAFVRRAHDKPSADPAEHAREFLLRAYRHPRGRFGSRRIERAGRADVAVRFRWAGVYPGHGTIRRFRDHQKRSPGSESRMSGQGGARAGRTDTESCPRPGPDGDSETRSSSVPGAEPQESGEFARRFPALVVRPRVPGPFPLVENRSLSRDFVPLRAYLRLNRLRPSGYDGHEAEFLLGTRPTASQMKGPCPGCEGSEPFP